MAKQSALQSILASGTVVAVDTADFNTLRKFGASEGTTNPSLLYAAAADPQYARLVDEAVAYGRSIAAKKERRQQAAAAVEYLAVGFGTEILDCGCKCVATEIDVRHSFDTEQTIAAALRVIALYAQRGIAADRVRIKISATWEGIQAARKLESEHGVGTLVTIVFGMTQAIAAAQAGVTMIAPYVGRIGDWHKARGSKEGEMMGVVVVSQMQAYLRKWSFKTKVMGASFRSPEQALALRGTDVLTIGPKILDQLAEMQVENAPEPVTLPDGALEEQDIGKSEDAFKWAYIHDACAVEKSAEAMRKFGEDTEMLEALLLTKF
ncbi:putative transaldolase [Lineolata rhizophorae]|uniref:Transaldolase n=1 Tax=Lineolata rhizophorae TaxID=578093 RepID=A0A6A6P5H6_9PEZI|nr:putative transaldolase [Lineolata rhizophorae]